MQFFGYFTFHITFLLAVCFKECTSNLPPSFTHDMNNLVLSENTPIGEIIFKLEGTDPENSSVHYGLNGIDLLEVNSDTGEVTVVKQLDHEINNTLQFSVTIEDEVNEPPFGRNNIVEVPVTVIILDENDNPPIFDQIPYAVAIDEDTPVGLTVFSNIYVRDVDTVGNSIEVDCIDLPNFENACSIFDVVTIDAAQSTYHGVLVLKEKLDFRLQEFYQFQLKATDGELNSTTTVSIEVGDVQDTPPTFQSSLNAEVDENAPINTLILTVNAIDGDRGMPRPIVYELIDNPMNYFLLNATTGEIRTARPLDREAVENPQGVLMLNIRAIELINGVKGTDSLTMTDTEVSITIKDVNDEPPLFNKNEYHVEISETTPIGFTIQNLDMVVSDPDTGNNSIFSLSLEDISYVFEVNPATVVGSSAVTITVKNNSLDYEDPNQRKFIILVIAREMYTNPQLSSTATVTVTVTDANDNAPYFDLLSYSASISEMAAPGTSVIRIVAKDRDSGEFGENGIVYELIGEGAEKFSVNNRTGVVSVNNCDDPGTSECLDYEINSKYLLSFKATDNNGKGLTTAVPLTVLLTDSNDNSPAFSKPFYDVFIDEGMLNFEKDLILQATDLDKTSHVTYSIIEGNANGLFSIDSKSGRIKITNNKGINFNENPEKNHILLTVEATDGKYKTSTVVNITVLDVNNNAPEFDMENYVVSLEEDAKIGSRVLQVKATDADTGLNAQIKYHIRKGSKNDFVIDDTTGIITVASNLDYDRQNIYNIELIATDQGPISLSGTATLTLELININNKDPYFVPAVQKAEIMKNAEIGTVVHTLTAVDPDINSSEALNYAIVEPITALDKFHHVVNNDLYKDFFTIDQNTGSVMVLNSLHRDIAAFVNITVVATDTTAPTLQQGKGTLVITITDINDHPPTFLPPWTVQNPEYNLQMQEELPVGTIVATFTAVDDDSDIAGYNIVPKSRFFEINNGTGIIQIKERIDYEETTSLNFTIVAYDSGVPQLNASALILVTILNINDNIPVFSSPEYNATVKENSPSGTHIITVKATDLDIDEFGEVTYGLTGQNSEHFRISPESGEIFVANPLFLDYETLNATSFMVTATDSAPGNMRHSVTTIVNLFIIDVNDNRPKFNQNVYNITLSQDVAFNPPLPVLQVGATDPDEGINGNINYVILSGNQEDKFLLGEDTGIVYVSKSLIGFTSNFSLEIEARDGAGTGLFTDRAFIHIYVVNVNKHKPMFILPSTLNTTIEVNETDIVTEYLVTTVKALDNDKGESGRLTYHFKFNDTNVEETNDFIIDKNTGELKSLIYLHNEMKKKYELTLVAQDHGSPLWYETMCYLTIVIVNPDGDMPTFLNSWNTTMYHFYVTENSKANTLVGQVKAVNSNRSKFGKIYYYLLMDNENSTFYVDKLDGSIYTNKMFNREDVSEYNLLVLANNEPDFYLTNQDPKTYNNTVEDDSIAKIKITINDLNDNPPRFEKTIYHAAVKSMANKNGYFFNVSATDPDLGVNGTFVYFIQTSSLYKYGTNNLVGSLIPSPFNITQNGQLFIAMDLSENNQHYFVIDVVAKEIAYPEQKGSTKVYVWIFESEQLIRIILSRPVEVVLQEQNEIISELSNVTNSIVVIHTIQHHIDDNGQTDAKWSDMYILVVDPITQTIMPVPEILKIVDAKYDYLKDYYAGFAIENVVPVVAVESKELFDPVVSALIVVFLVLIVGIVTFITVCFYLRRMIAPGNLKKDALINKAIIDDLNTTENPLWIEQKLKIYEEQELSMQVFNEPEHVLQRNCEEFIPDDNTYATIQHPNRRGSAHTLSLADDMADYATLSRHPHDSTNYDEAALGFQGSTFQVPDVTEHNNSYFPLRSNKPHHSSSELSLNNNAQLDYAAKLI